MIAPHVAQKKKEKTEYRLWLSEQSQNSSKYIEKLMEHVFLGELLKECWFHRRKTVEVTRAEVDAAGYDVILELDEVIRHVQLKATLRGGATHEQWINRKLEKRLGGCIIWMEYTPSEDGPLGILYRWRRAGNWPAQAMEKGGRIRLTRRDFAAKTESVADFVELLFPLAKQSG